jgi:small subunit ribosomal protein S13
MPLRAYLPLAKQPPQRHGIKYMIRLGDITLLRSEKAPLSATLQEIYGVSHSSATKFVNYAGLNPSTRLGSQSQGKIKWILQLFRNYVSEHGLLIDSSSRSKNIAELQYLREINCQRGLRNAQGLTVRGQKSKSNGRTQRRLRGR